MTIVAPCVGAMSSVVGLIVSYHLSTPPGATIALVAIVAFLGAFLATLPRRIGGSPQTDAATPTAERSDRAAAGGT